MGELKQIIGERTAHLCIDMQQLFAPGGPWAAPWLERILPVVVALVGHSPAHTVFTRFIPAKSPEEAPGMWSAYYRKWRDVALDRIEPRLLDLLPDLRRFVPPAQHFDRTTYSGFANGVLHGMLRTRQVHTVVISGSETDVCVLATVLAAVDHGYRTIIVEDAVASSSDESHDALLNLYSKRFDVQIEVASAREIITAWQI